MFWVILLALVAAGWLLVARARANAAAPRRSVEPAHRQGHSGEDEPWPDGYDLAVVGESHYQDALRRIAGPGAVRHYCGAMLIPEPKNPHDNMAVAVMAVGRRVGYLSREDARAYRDGFCLEKTPCEAVIVGGGPGKPSLGIWLDFEL